MTSLPASFRLTGNRLSLDPRDPGFFNDPWPSYAALHGAAPVFFWEQ